MGAANGFRNLQIPSAPASKQASEPLPGEIIKLEEGDQIVNGSEDVWAIIEEFTGEIDDPAGGTYFWGMQDLDNSSGGGDFAHTLVFSNVNVSGYSGVELSFVYNVYEFDNGDDLEYEVFFDDVGQGTVLLFEGSGDKSTIGWEEETIAVPEGTITVSLVLSATQNGGGDYAGFDNIRLASPPPAYSISKSAPATITPGEAFTYTLTVENATGVTPTTTTITDVLPSGVDFIAASDSGSLNAGTISWTVSDFADGSTLTRTFQVTATGTHGTEVENAAYGVNGGSDWMTTTTGTTVTTQIVGACDSIYNIQFPGGDSLCDGETAVVEGIVYAVYGDNFALAEDAGAWHGVYVYNNNGVPVPDIGDSIQITGTVDEYSSLTELTSVTYTVMSTGTTPYAASVISTSAANNGEAYEGVLVEVQDVLVDNPDLGYGEWSVDDGSGAVRVDDLGYDYSATAGEALDAVRGMLHYAHGDYKIEPRDADDVVPFAGTGLVVSKNAPAVVDPGTLLTYTLTVNNQTGGTLTDLVISDTLPLSATYASADPMGNWNAATHTITWTETSLAHDNVLTYTLVITAPDATTMLTNEEYVAYATEWTTPTTGTPAETYVSACSTIYDIQYVPDPATDDASPCTGQDVTVTGIVYANYGNGQYFIADAAGPWHGLYIYNGGNVAVGDEVEVSGGIQEWYGVTELYADSDTVLSSGNAVYGPSVVTAAQIPVTDTATSEAYEGVFVETRDITVTATGNHNIWSFTDSSGGTAKADDWGYDADPAVGDTYAVLRGALAYDFSEYKIMPRTADDVVGYQLALNKTAPANVDPGALYTYTLTVENYTGADLTDVVLTDTVPTNATFAYALDSGVQNDNVISWTTGTLDNLTSFTVQFAVTATTDNVLIWNNDYAVDASNYPTPTTGAPVMTLVGDELSIHHIQGDGLVTPLEGQAVTGVDGIVTAVHDEGFYMQEPDPDADPQTSEGIYVYTKDAPTVSVGDVVDVDGDVDEYYGTTQIKDPTVTVAGSGTINPTDVLLPVTDINDYEAYEGMLLTFPQEMTVNDLYNLGRYGTIRLSQGGRLYNPTSVITPGTPAQNLQEANDLRSLLLDDGSSASYPDPIPYPNPALSTTNTIRSGDVVTDLTGVLGYDFGEYRLHPTLTPDFTTENPRPDTPEDVGGTVQVASFNVLNYFNTFGDDNCAGGVNGDPEDCRGADDQAEFERQRAKIITALVEIDADVVGLMEIENDGYGPNSAVADLVNALNAAGTDTYAFIDPDAATGITNSLGVDAIKVAMIYKTGAVTPTGTTAPLNTDAFVDPNNIGDDKNRPALAQSFMDSEGQIFTVVVNHLKSKGSPCGAGDDVPDYEGGNCNDTRTKGVEEMLAWLDTDPTGVNDSDVLIIGDLNAYAREDPVTALQDADYTDLISHYEGAMAYSYVYFGQAGYLDHGLASTTLARQVTGTTIWHINADEPRALDYNDDEPNDEPAHYADDSYRASDHDPVIIGLDLGFEYYFPIIFKNGN